jgi:hypothetical protein
MHVFPIQCPNRKLTPTQPPRMRPHLLRVAPSVYRASEHIIHVDGSVPASKSTRSVSVIAVTNRQSSPHTDSVAQLPVEQLLLSPDTLGPTCSTVPFVLLIELSLHLPRPMSTSAYVYRRWSPAAADVA